MWLLPSRRRPFYLKTFIKASFETGLSTPGWILVDREDFSDLRDEYESLTLPQGWEFVLTEKFRLGDKIQEVWEKVISLPWIGILNDDHLPRTANWDRKVIDSLNGWNIVSTDDGNFPPHPAGAQCWSGDLLRAAGFMFPPGIYHLFIDSAWAYLGRATGCWQIRTDVMIEHFDAGRSGLRDETFQIGRNDFDGQYKAYCAWLESDGQACIERIRKLRETYFSRLETPDALFCRAGDLFADGNFQECIEPFEKFLSSSSHSTMRAIAFIKIARARAALRGSSEKVVEAMLRAVAEQPRARFVWSQMAELMCVAGDWPNCFSAVVNAFRGHGVPEGLMHADPGLQIDIHKLLELSSQNLRIGDSVLNELRMTPGFIS